MKSLEYKDPKDWADQMGRRVAAHRAAFKQPAGVETAFWEMLLLFAAYPGSFAELCLTQGKAWSKADRKKVKAAPPGECFRNASELALANPELTYVEGFGCTAQVGMALHHAWVVDPQGKVIDPTWLHGTSYCGVPVETTALQKIMLDTNTWGVFGSARLPRWVAEDPDSWLAPVNGHELASPKGR